jgi:type I site-specific restriction-modification system R (restriction) subunit
VGGVPVEVEIDGERRGDRVVLVDFDTPERNRFLVVNQFTVQGSKQPRRPDLVCFINGLPIAVIELKNLAAEQVGIKDAFHQLQTYKDELADLFVTNEALVASDGLQARVGSLTASFERFLPWRTVKNENDRPLLEYELEKVVRGFFAPALLLDYLRYFVLFEMADGQVVKKIAAYPPIPRRACGGEGGGDCRHAARAQHGARSVGHVCRAGETGFAHGRRGVAHAGLGQKHFHGVFCRQADAAARHAQPPRWWW